MTKRFLYIIFLLIITACNQTGLDKIITTNNKIEEYLKLAYNDSESIENRKKYADSTYKLLRILDDDIYKRKKLKSLSEIYYQIKDYEASNVIDLEMLKISSLINDSLGIATSHSFIGITYRRKKMLDSAFNNFYKADKIYRSFDKNNSHKPIEYYYDHGKVLIDLGKLLRIKKDYVESEKFIIKALEKFKFIENNVYIPKCYSNLGIISKNTERYEDAIKYFLKSLEFSEKTEKNETYIVSTYNNIGTVYKSMKQYEKAIKNYENGLKHKEYLSEKPATKARLIDNLAYSKFLFGDNDSLPDLFYQSLQLREKIKNFPGIATNSIHLAEFYRSKNNDSLALVFAKKAEEAAYKGKDNDDILESLQLLSEVSEPKTGLEYAQKYIALNDSLIKEERLYRDKFARIRFETDQKEQQIIKVQNQNTVYLLGMLLLLSLIGFALFVFRQRTQYLAQQNKIVQTRAAYETETRISKRLHDELGNDIFQVMLQYQNNPHDPEIVNRLNITYNKARDISRENSEFEVDETYGEELADMLQNYTNNGVQLILRGLDKLEWDNFSSTVKIAIYRVLQELMTNMQKHSQASLVALIFTYDTKKLIIKYSDNGVGIPDEQLTSKNGLRNTEKRIQAIHGTLIFDSEKDKGFKAEIKIPIE